MRPMIPLMLLGAALTLSPLPRTAADPAPVMVRPAPVLAPGPWINGVPTTLAAQRGKVVVLTFWTRDCINCKHTLPFWNAWAKRYQGSNVAVISVHTPETPSEYSLSETRRFVQQHGLEFPVLVDNHEQNWDAFHVEFWPTTILIDKQGRIRDEYTGELNYEDSGEYQLVRAEIERLRAERA